MQEKVERKSRRSTLTRSEEVKRLINALRFHAMEIRRLNPRAPPTGVSKCKAKKKKNLDRLHLVSYEAGVLGLFGVFFFSPPLSESFTTHPSECVIAVV